MPTCRWTLALSANLTLFGPANHIPLHTWPIIGRPKLQKRYAELLSELPAGQNEIGQRVASAVDAAQPFVRRRNHTAYVLTYHRTNERQDTAPKISGLKGVLPKIVSGWCLFGCEPVE